VAAREIGVLTVGGVTNRWALITDMKGKVRKTNIFDDSEEGKIEYISICRSSLFLLISKE
jgi:hypothetical protein